MRFAQPLALSFSLVLAACTTPEPGPVDAGPAACAPVDAGCSESQACCDGASCMAGQCACVALEGARCGNGEPTCCAGMTCDPTGHCHATCAGPAGACTPVHGKCSASTECCAPAACVDGVCEARTPACSSDGESCKADTDCCGSTTLKTRPACVATDAGSFCRFGRRGEGCNPERPCLAAFTCIVDAGTPAAPDAGLLPDGGLDPDAGTPPGPVDAGTAGTCGVPGNPGTCTLRSATCALGASCDPNNSTNQGYDPCGLMVSGGSLAYRPNGSVCHSGVCSLPQLWDSCTSRCLETGGATSKTTCAALDFESWQEKATGKVCATTCTTDADCPGTFYPSGTIAGAQRFGSLSHAPVSMWCVDHPELGKKLCQPRLCYEDTPARDAVGFLFKACPDSPNSICLPRTTATLSDYFGMSHTSTVFGFCQAVRPNAPESTVGQACDERAGTESPSMLCGPDAVCVGGLCRAVCDASLPGDYFPACGPTEKCLEAHYGTDPLAGHQTGFCGTACNPFVDEENSGCSNFCGGPRSRCQWQGLDKVPGLGHCAPMTKTPKAIGAACGSSLECTSGAICWSTADDRSNPVCTRMCNQQAQPGALDACKQGTCEPLYDGADKVGICQ